MGKTPTIPTLLLAFIGLASMSNNANADTYVYSGYTYYTPVNVSTTTIRSYNTATSVDLYVATWYDTTTSPYFVDSLGRTWRWTRPSVEIKRGYGFYGSYLYSDTRYYQRMCGTVRVCSRTGLITFTCACGDVYWLE